MLYNRRSFLGNTIKGAILLSAGNLLQAYDAAAYGLPPASKVMMRFALCSDGHYGQPKTEFEKNHQQMVEWINAEKANRGVDLCFVNGDLYHNDKTVAAALKAQWDKLNMPYYVSHGNHDHGTEEEWQQTWTNPWNYGFEKNKCGFIVLNTADKTGKYVCPTVDSTKALLEQYKDHRHLFVIMHITPIKWTDNANPCPEIVALFEQQSNLRAIFHGHDHDQDDVKEQNGKHYFFDSHIGGSWGTAYHGYRIVEIMDDGEILTYQMNPAVKEKMNSKQIGMN